jgi:cation transport protein ChaC
MPDRDEPSTSATEPLPDPGPSAAAHARPLRREDLELDLLRRNLAATEFAPFALTEAEVEASLRSVLAAPDRPAEVWVFAYGSLVWNPIVEYEDRVVVTVHGYHRRFCLWSRTHRGTPDYPGLVLGLDRGGRCTGVAYRLAAANAEQELRLLWRREMLLGSYSPRWVFASHGRRHFRALAFVINRDRPGYAGHLAPEQVVERLIHGRGHFGTGLEYLRSTIDGLAAAGIRDPNLLRLDALARQSLGDEEARRTRTELRL